MQPSTAFPTRPQAPVQAVPVTVWLARIALAAAFMTVITFAAALIVASAFGLRYQGKIYPGVSAWGIDLSGQSPAAAAASLTDQSSLTTRLHIRRRCFGVRAALACSFIRCPPWD